MVGDAEHHLAEIVLQKGFCTREQVDEASRALAAAKSGGLDISFGEVLVRKGYLDEEALLEASKLALAAAPSARPVFPVATPAIPARGPGVQAARLATPPPVAAFVASMPAPAPPSAPPPARPKGAARASRNPAAPPGSPPLSPRGSSPSARRTRKKGFPVWIAFAASFGLTFPILIGAFFLLRPEEEDEGAGDERASTTTANPDGRPPKGEAAGRNGAPGAGPTPGGTGDRFPRGGVPRPDPAAGSGNGDSPGASGDGQPPGQPSGGRSEEPWEENPEGTPGDRVEDLLAKARDHALAKNYQEALTYMTYLLKTAGDDPRIREEVTRIETLRRIDIQTWLDEAEDRLERGDVAGARRKVQVVLWWKPGDEAAEALLRKIEGH